jgi:hypothetical protein
VSVFWDDPSSSFAFDPSAEFETDDELQKERRRKRRRRRTHTHIPHGVNVSCRLQGRQKHVSTRHNNNNPTKNRFRMRRTFIPLKVRDETEKQTKIPFLVYREM